MDDERDFYAETREVLEFWFESGADIEQIRREVGDIMDNLIEV
jgi:hypothetical protein